MESEKSRSTFLAEEAIRAYPALKAEYHRLKYSKPGGYSDPTATAALRELPPEEQRQYEAVRRAILRTSHLWNGKAQLMVIRLHYWEGTLPLEEIAEKLDLSLKAVKHNRKNFIRMVRELLSISRCEGCCYYRRFTSEVKACFYCLDTGQLRLRGETEEPVLCPYYQKKEAIPDREKAADL